MRLSPHNAPTRITEGRDANPRVVICDPRRPNVAIVGFGHTAAAVRAVQDRAEWEIWGLNNGYQNPIFYDGHQRFRADRWFELHPVAVQPAPDLAWLHACPIPIYVLDLKDPHPDGYSPQAVEYPLMACEALLPLPRPFWAATFAYQVALAISEGFAHIALLGLDFSTPREWLFERPNLLFWAGVAAGRGIRLTWPVQSTVLHHGGRYGYDYTQECAWCQEGVAALMDQWGYMETAGARAHRQAHEQALREAIGAR